MKVVNPNLTTHTTKFIPRFESTENITFELYNETSKNVDTITSVATITDGIMSLVYDFTFSNKQKYQIKVYNNDGVIYRGKLIATNQGAQDYKLTKDLYFYE